jgi:hypothetical protein
MQLRDLETLDEFDAVVRLQREVRGQRSTERADQVAGGVRSNRQPPLVTMSTPLPSSPPWSFRLPASVTAA